MGRKPPHIQVQFPNPLNVLLNEFVLYNYLNLFTGVDLILPSNKLNAILEGFMLSYDLLFKNSLLREKFLMFVFEIQDFHMKGISCQRRVPYILASLIDYFKGGSQVLKSKLN